jgi:hypothetical protein
MYVNEIMMLNNIIPNKIINRDLGQTILVLNNINKSLMVCKTMINNMKNTIEERDLQDHFLNKIFYRCKSKSIQLKFDELRKKIINKFNEHLKKINNCESNIDKFIQQKLYDNQVLKCNEKIGCYYNESGNMIRRYLHLIKNELLTLTEELSQTFGHINVLMLIRRLVDKSYVNKAIFIGYIHSSIFAIQVCCVYFGFTVDYASLSKLSIPDLNKKILESEKLEPFNMFRSENNFEFSILPTYVKNCVDVTELINFF